MTGFESEGVYWEGSKRDMSAWKAYKRAKAVRFVELNYSVAWYPDGSNWMDVFVPERPYAHRPEVRADVKFFREPSQHGIDGGRISKLTIATRTVDPLAQVLGKPFEKVEVLYNFDRGLDIDRLHESPRARRLYQVVMRELG